MYNQHSYLLRQGIAWVVVLALASGIGLFMATGSSNQQGILLALVVIACAAAAILFRYVQIENWNTFSWILTLGLVFRLAFSIVFIWISYHFYGGLADAGGYNAVGSEISRSIRQLDFSQVAIYMQWGTQFLDVVTGVIYSIIGQSLVGAFLVFGLFAFLGSYFFYRTFRSVFPNGNRALFAALVFFFPSILFWANGLGKDALIFLSIGMFSYGLAEIVRGRLSAVLFSIVGLAGTLWIRPHVAGLLVLALLLAFILPVKGKRIARFGASAVVLAGAAISLWLLLPRLMDFVGLQSVSIDSILKLLEQQQGLTILGGGSTFKAVSLSNPAGIPMAFITVFFRPFPWEATNILSVLQSLEGLFLVALVIWRFKNILTAFRLFFSNTYIRFIFIYILLFALVFTFVQNFGILARQRTMVLPFLFMILALAPSTPGRIEQPQEKPARYIRQSF